MKSVFGLLSLVIVLGVVGWTMKTSLQPRTAAATPEPASGSAASLPNTKAAQLQAAQRALDEANQAVAAAAARAASAGE